MWKANKGAIIALLLGLASLAGAYFFLCRSDKQLAEQVLCAGICILLFVVASVNWYLARRGM
ncbi:MAG: hypothetical protein IJ498_04425 [Akkermansia sp.]|nr:hypothetical protein [Akkermansia sp.]